MTILTDIQAQYKNVIQDLGSQLEAVNGGGNAVRDAAIAEAVEQYTNKIPRVITALVNAISTGFYALPTDWTRQSRIVSVEFPINQNPPSYLNRKNWALRRTESGDTLVLLSNPSSSFRLSYTAKHSSADLTTVPAEHVAPIAKMAVAAACEAFAAKYAGSVSNNLDAVNYRTKEQEYRAVAAELRGQAERSLRTDEIAQYASTDPDAGIKGWKL